MMPRRYVEPDIIAGWLHDSFERLAELAELGPGWDGDDAAQVSPRSLDEARRFLLALQVSLPTATPDGPQPDAIMPLLSGGVQLEWASPRGALEIEVKPDGTLGYLIAHGQGASREFEEQDESSMPELLHLAAQLLRP